MDACACIAAAATAAHECSANAFSSASGVCIGNMSSADSFCSALLILCAVADFNMRSSSLLRAALAAAIACCCPRGRILLASAAFPCEVWGKDGLNHENEASSEAEDEELGVAQDGGMRDVARAIRGQGGALDVSELIADESEAAGGRAALCSAIGGAFINQLMQVAVVRCSL